jgi:alpha-beta hydrolase superfamily lysophospholipase
MMQMACSSVQIRHREDLLQASDGLKLFEQSWSVEVPRALVVVVHGYAEHSARYELAALHLARNAYAVQAFDLRGHGRSQGKRCFVRAFDDYLDDLHVVLLRARRRWPGKPVFLLGHSLGGLIASLFVIGERAELSGLILSAPSVKLGRDFSERKARASVVLGRLFPHLPTVRFRSSSISRDPTVVQAYQTDALVYHGRAPARTASEIVRATQRVQLNMERIAIPLLVMHGGHDQVADIEGSRELCERARSADKCIRICDGLYHEIMNEPEKASVLEEMSDWLNARTSQLIPEDQPPN